MELMVEGQSQQFIPIQLFREQHNLPESFGIAAFASADMAYNPFWQQVDQQLDEISERLKAVIPLSLTTATLPEVPLLVTTIFEHELVAAGADMELTRDEVEITTTDFQNVLEPAVYKLVELSYLNGGNKAAVRAHFDIQAIYQEMVDSTVFVNGQIYEYDHQGATWEIQTIHCVYGPVGLKVNTATAKQYVADYTLAFPAHEFLKTLAIRVGEKICAVFTRG